MLIEWYRWNESATSLTDFKNFGEQLERTFGCWIKPTDKSHHFAYELKSFEARNYEKYEFINFIGRERKKEEFYFRFIIISLFQK